MIIQYSYEKGALQIVITIQIPKMPETVADPALISEYREFFYTCIGALKPADIVNADSIAKAIFKEGLKMQQLVVSEVDIIIHDNEKDGTETYTSLVFSKRDLEDVDYAPPQLSDAVVELSASETKRVSNKEVRELKRSEKKK